MNLKSGQKAPKIGLICSSGGHLFQAYVLEPWWREFSRFWVTFEKPDADSLLEKETVYHAYFPTNRNIPNLIRNFWVAWRVLRKEKPDVLFSTGAGVAIPFFVLGKLFGIKLIYLEVFDRLDSPTLTGKIVHPLCDRFLVQWDEQKRFYSKGELWGQVL